MKMEISKKIIDWITGKSKKKDKILNIEIKYSGNGVQYPVIRICEETADEFGGFKQKITDLDKAARIILKALEKCDMKEDINSEVYITTIKTKTFIRTYYTLFEITKFTPIVSGASKGGFRKKTVKSSQNWFSEETKRSSVLITEDDKRKDCERISNSRKYKAATEKNIKKLLKKMC